MSNQYLFTNFGDLYRAAFAELNPGTKQLLLAEVKKALDRWEESITEGVASQADEHRVATIRQAA
jgi:phage baseplate assembly protein W